MKHLFFISPPIFLILFLQEELRIAHRSMEVAEEKGITGPWVMWHHLDCFAKPDTLESVGWLPSYGGEQLDGYSSLKKPEKKMIKKKLPM